MISVFPQLYLATPLVGGSYLQIYAFGVKTLARFLNCLALQSFQGWVEESLLRCWISRLAQFRYHTSLCTVKLGVLVWYLNWQCRSLQLVTNKIFLKNNNKTPWFVVGQQAMVWYNKGTDKVKLAALFCLTEPLNSRNMSGGSRQVVLNYVLLICLEGQTRAWVLNCG